MDEPRWYHGTRRGFTRGGVLIPRSQHGQPGTTAPLALERQSPTGHDEWVYLTQDETLAWVYAWHAPGRGKPKVLVVRPCGEVEPDPEHSAAMNAWRAEWARVTDVLTDPVLTETEARAGWVTSGA